MIIIESINIASHITLFQPYYLVSLLKFASMKANVLTILFFSLPIICIGQRKEFKNASKINTVKAYTVFLEQYPNSKFSKSAKENKTNLCVYIDKLMKSYANLSTSYLKPCLETKNEADVEHFIETLFEGEMWSKALTKNSSEDFEAFVIKFPNSKYVEIAKNNIENLEWKNTLKVDTEEDYKKFKTRFPDSKRNKEADSILIILKTFALPRAAKKGDIQKVKILIANADSNIKSHALMEAVWGALYTAPAIETQKKKVGGYEYNDYDVISKRLGIAPRESYISIIELLLQNKANPEHFSFESFGSVEVSKKERADALAKQVAENGYVSISQKIGGDINLKLIPFGTGGFSIKDVAEIHKAEDILQLLKN